MAQQKSENPIVPEGRGNTPRTGLRRGGKGVPVNPEDGQLELGFATAESPRGTARERVVGRPTPRPDAAPKAKSKEEGSHLATLESVVASLDEALHDVVRNKGAPGPDGLTVEDARDQWPTLRDRLATQLTHGNYQPGPIRRVEIPKPDGGVRTLGIPNVVDRIVQAALKRVLERVWEPTFDPSSHGFRPLRSCHTALSEACQYLDEGYEWMVDLDLSKFFDRVHHQRLMARIAQRVTDRGLLVVVGRVVGSEVVLPSGVCVRSEEGVPQGGPLSPLLSNIVLDELDQELRRRGHRFVRYADDVSIFVRSERAGHRVMGSITRFIEKRLRLKVNTEKSSVRRPDRGNFLGFSMKPGGPDGRVEVTLSERTLKRAYSRIRELTPRNWGGSLGACIRRLGVYLVGWFGYFKGCTEGARRQFNNLDAHIRRRLRAIQLKHWKRKRVIARKLLRMKASRKVRPSIYGGRRSLWVLSNLGVVTHRLSKAWFAELGLPYVLDLFWNEHVKRVAPAPEVARRQMSLPLVRG